MKGSKGLQVASFILLLTHFTSVKSDAQNSLVKLASDTPAYVKDDSTAPLSTSSQPDELKTAPFVFTPEPKALTTRDPRKFGLIDRAYLDAFTILNDDNSCSRFFGGRYAISALNEMVFRLKPRTLQRDVAIRMSGPTTLVQSHATGFNYRLFEKMELNRAGSFFRTPAPFERRSTVTPEFPPNTRETRVVVLLHELGHLVRGVNKQYVLPDDGEDPNLSLLNTQRVVSVCRQQIETLSQWTAEKELEMTTTSLARTSTIMP